MASLCLVSSEDGGIEYLRHFDVYWTTRTAKKTAVFKYKAYSDLIQHMCTNTHHSQEQTGPHLLKKLAALCGTPTVTAALTGASNVSLSRARSIQSTYPHSNSLIPRFDMCIYAHTYTFRLTTYRRDRAQWPTALRLRCATGRLLGLRVRIPQGA